ncbi:FUSC family protein [Streptomyces luteosporeus]|uniref:Integral membrane bound transporter domain-containing protein n=1 Tax=Streptomyces luteosporeus TaxID=173856 RepID=A0ABN3TVC6_9ACTN
MAKHFSALVRLRPAADIWYKPALSAVVAMAVPDAVLLAAGRLDLALYTAAGALCALYGHDLPYARRARALAGVVLGTLAGVGTALTCSALTGSAPVLVLGAALVAAAHRAACDASGIGPPGNVVLTFVTSSAFFVPQRPGDVPGHLALVAATGALAWLVCMAPAVRRPHGPERVAVARALAAPARLLEAATPAELAAARHAAVTAIGAARRAVAGRPPVTQPLASAEAALAALATGETDAAAAVRLRAAARAVRRDRTALAPVGRAAGPALRGTAPLPVAARVALGAALAGWASLALGSAHPYWAVVSAASVVQPNTTLSWQRAVQRALGNLLGLALFTALLPVARTGAAALVGLSLALQFGAEALISRNYWLGSVCVTPMALLLGEFAAPHPAGGLVADRWTDTLVGCAVGLLACAAVTNRRATRRAEAALVRARAARHAAAAARLHAAVDREQARDRLAAALVELRTAADVAAGEWWQPAPAAARAARASREEHEGHRVLAALHGRAPASSAP